MAKTGSVLVDIPSLTKEIFEGRGNAQEKLLRLYGKDLAYNNAKKYLAGIKLHLETLQRVEKNKQEFAQKEVSYNADKSQTIRQDIYLTENEAASPVLIMQKCGFDPLLWEVITCKLISGSWDVTIKNDMGDGILYTNRKYSVTLTVKPLGGKLTMPQVLEAFKELPPVKIAPHEHVDGEFMLELPIMDFHLGKLAWGEETGQEDYDLKIAEELWKETVKDLFCKVYAFGIPDYILFPIGQDFFHFDTPNVTTTAGTQLDSDTRWQKMFRKGVELLVWAIEQCHEFAPVKVMWIPGNHDQMLSYAATVGIAQRYADTNDIEVDLSPARRKYHLYGANLIGFAHGEDEGKRIEGLMQIESPEAWGKSVWREMHMGHLHSESTTTVNGIVFRRISAITAPDAWHSEKGFIGSVRQAQAFIWQKERGLLAILNSNVTRKA
jgi:hypothetical protein